MYKFLKPVKSLMHGKEFMPGQIVPPGFEHALEKMIAEGIVSKAADGGKKSIYDMTSRELDIELKALDMPIYGTKQQKIDRLLEGENGKTD